MFLKQRQKPIMLEKLEVLQNRLLEDHPELPKINREVAQRQAGYKGELRLDYFLRYLPQTYSILNDVTLTLDNVRTQFDSIILSNHAIYLIEVKNITGAILSSVSQIFADKASATAKVYFLTLYFSGKGEFTAI